MFLLSAFIFGLSQGFVVGPITLFGIQEGLNPKRGFWYQVQVSLGATCIDILYLLLAAYGAAQFLEYNLVKLILWSISSYMLIHMGLNSFSGRTKRMSLNHMHNSRARFYDSDFAKAMLINLFNPLAIVFWIMVAGGLYAESAQLITPFWFAMNIVGGGLIISFLVACTTMLVRKIFHQWMLTKLIRLGSLMLMGYGFYFSFKALMELKPMLVSLFVF